MNAQRMLDLVRANEEAEEFDLGVIIDHCGTFGCLVGNYALSLGEGMNDWWWNKESKTLYQCTAERLGITKPEAEFLFREYDTDYRKWRIPIRSYPGLPRCRTDRHAAINRVRKFIYYKLRKRELLYDERGCVRETARRAEGDHHVVRHAQQKAREAVCA